MNRRISNKEPQNFEGKRTATVLSSLRRSEFLVGYSAVHCPCVPPFPVNAYGWVPLAPPVHGRTLGDASGTQSESPPRHVSAVDLSVREALSLCLFGERFGTVDHLGIATGGDDLFHGVSHRGRVAPRRLSPRWRPPH